MKHILKQIFYIPLAVALGMGVMSCTGHSNVYEREEKEIAEKEKEAEENKKKAEESKQAIKEKEASKQKIELDNKNLQREEHKAWSKLQTSLDRYRFLCIGHDYFEPGLRPKCDRCGLVFCDIVSPGAFWQLDDEFSVLEPPAGSVGSNGVKELSPGSDFGSNELWKYTRLVFGACPHCRTHNAVNAIQAKVNTNMFTITNIENTITEEKYKIQQAETAYTANSSCASTLKKRIDRSKKEIEERLKVQAEVEEMKKEKINTVKILLSNKVDINVIMMSTGFSREEIKKIGIDVGIDIDYT